MPKTHDKRDGPANLIGERLKQAREAGKFWSQLDIAQALPHDINLDRNAIYKIEHQLRGVKDYELVALAKLLDVRVEWLLGLTDEGGP